ncbi:LacI family DNA-binding transcriptional regulator [Deinococcus peraridilitoris]|uniref:Transcriptional regulator n=1 Tax=Deinococcus peraridilitoris (strain DSM 19664 / LMG 22246 / CIP 109416 / KR-200) TaxID=937777 RepID=L0A190_DEIPD|nr:LacI family DNA-binding transcriptional regulator [Deinococcus peraridilitoris]AFZ66785.1 transcriptional regulator [Deinococcus peraridilitoris DSM 19664]
MSGPEVTLSDLARMAGVSAMTVSRVLNNRPGVGEETRQRVLKLLSGSGYTPNVSARSLAGNRTGGRTQVLGMVVPDLSTQYIAEIARGAGEAAVKHRYDVILYTSTNVKNAYERIHAMTRGIVDGLLMVLPQVSEEYTELLGRTRLPVVIIDHRGGIAETPAVTVDNYTGARLAVDHLVGLGHRRIGFITGRMDTRASQERLRGYREGLLVHGLTVDEALVRPADFLRPSGFRAAGELLELNEPPSAIFVSNDVMAFGAMDAIKDHGLRIPDDISVIGFDDIPMSAQVHPPLTTVRQPLYEMGAAATTMLITLLTDVSLSTERPELSTELIVRASTGHASHARVPRRGTGRRRA